MKFMSPDPVSADYGQFGQYRTAPRSNRTAQQIVGEVSLLGNFNEDYSYPQMSLSISHDILHIHCETSVKEATVGEEYMDARIDLESSDYEETNANDRHTPKPPGRT
ncbi:hypothetical protein QJS10_CPA09g01527 [Acorus calamus]|uniref:Uncharacterized protein n=1 Tax=Acorus calamus TaxID=4465 RepID=A0AAV9E476_ACOCL|nr:hypothetical protein QJS10_CPA09g01527 [Acorus calamus]